MALTDTSTQLGMTLEEVPILHCPVRCNDFDAHTVLIEFELASWVPEYPRFPVSAASVIAAVANAGATLSF
jgi:hypothetical protein